jgi:hypothetical protein
LQFEQLVSFFDDFWEDLTLGIRKFETAINVGKVTDFMRVELDQRMSRPCADFTL